MITNLASQHSFMTISAPLSHLAPLVKAARVQRLQEKAKQQPTPNAT